MFGEELELSGQHRQAPPASSWPTLLVYEDNLEGDSNHLAVIYKVDKVESNTIKETIHVCVLSVSPSFVRCVTLNTQKGGGKAPLLPAGPRLISSDS